MKSGRTVLAAIVAVVMFSACNRLGSQDAVQDESAQLKRDATSTQEGSVGSEIAPDAAAPQIADNSRGAATSQEPLPPIPPNGNPAIGDKVIKNATVEIEVDKGEFQRQFGRAGDVAAQFGGFVAGRDARETDGKTASGTVTIRVPSDKLDAALDALRDLGRLTGEQQASQDVSTEFVDLEARLRHAKTQEAFYLRLMERATTIADLIQIQSQLSQVQLQIEEIQGRLNFLKDQTAYSTITVRIFEPGVSTARGRLGKAWAEAIEGFKSVIAGLVVFVGWMAPLVLLGLIVVIAWRLLRRRPKAATPAG